MKKFLRVTASALVLTGLALIAVDLAGLFLYTTIDGDEPGAERQTVKRISARAFWEQAYREGGEPLQDYVVSHPAADHRLNARYRIASLMA